VTRDLLCLIAVGCALAVVFAAYWLARHRYHTEQCQTGQHHRCPIDSPTSDRQCDCACHNTAARAA
jgi:hypothetical protein